MHDNTQVIGTELRYENSQVYLVALTSQTSRDRSFMVYMGDEVVSGLGANPLSIAEQAGARWSGDAWSGRMIAVANVENAS
jgi:hypothetical protein